MNICVICQEREPHARFRCNRCLQYLYRTGRERPRTMTKTLGAKLGGLATSRRYGAHYMAEIGKRGGDTVAQDKAHMAEIGRKGGLA